MTNIAATKSLFAISPAGEECSLVLSVGVPEPHPQCDWACAVSLGALYSMPGPIFGADAWQALDLAMAFVVEQLDRSADQGWQFFWEKGGEPLLATELRHTPRLS